ncbi:hypothetical protein LTR94_024509 [Friedmanniomyces endolithicus]|nr:hypothetical protein LTR94_024509 [Friedmanniomyces endolithicus]
MTPSPPRREGLELEAWGEPDDPVVVFAGEPRLISPEWKSLIKALVAAGRYVVLARDGDDPFSLRAALVEAGSRPALVCSTATLERVEATLDERSGLISCLILVGEEDVASQDQSIATLSVALGALTAEAQASAIVAFLEAQAPREPIHYQGGSDPRTLRDALGCFATGVTVVTTTDEQGRPIGLTANSFSSVSLDPPLILFCLAKSSSNLERFRQAEHFAINVLHIGQQPMSGAFARANAERFDGIAWEVWETGAPILSGSLASFECLTDQVVEAGDHLVFIGRVTRARFEPRRDPLLYFRGRYRRLHFA